jgi:hypothetical protein
MSELSVIGRMIGETMRLHSQPNWEGDFERITGHPEVILCANWFPPEKRGAYR